MVRVALSVNAAVLSYRHSHEYEYCDQEEDPKFTVMHVNTAFVDTYLRMRPEGV